MSPYRPGLARYRRIARVVAVLVALAMVLLLAVPFLSALG